MAKIHTLKIKNYKGIQEFEQIFYNQSFICLIGRGDSGKTTILQAIAAVLSPYWDYKFYDMDFYNGNIECPIEIEASIYDLPRELLTETKFGLHKRLLNSENKIIDDISQEDQNSKDVLTIKLIVKKDLEPKWLVVNGRESNEDIEISATNRARLNVFMVSDYVDGHFAFGKGSPLYSLCRTQDDFSKNSLIVDANRHAYQNINQDNSFSSFDSVLKEISSITKNLGLSITEIKAFIDLKNILIKEGSLALHDENKLPLRLKGKGTKRLLSIAIQLELAKKEGGIILIDEIEQGLEPDRVRFLVKYLKESNDGQIFITTHSSNVIEELCAEDIFLKKPNENKLISFDKSFQGCIRNNANAFFAKRILLCEGATEFGICRALNTYRIEKNKPNFEFLGISLVNGTGVNMINYCQKFKEAGFDICLFCDSDDETVNSKKCNLKQIAVEIVDCDSNNAIEQQVFNDLPWDNVLQLIQYVIEDKGEQNIFSQLEIKNREDIKETLEMRTKIGQISSNKGENNNDKKKGKAWFKRIDHGKEIGKVWFSAIEKLEGKRLKTEFDLLMGWIDK